VVEQRQLILPKLGILDWKVNQYSEITGRCRES